MANIQVEPKNKAPGNPWIWVAVVLVITALVYFLTNRNRSTGNKLPADTASTVAVPGNNQLFLMNLFSEPKALLFKTQYNG